MNCNRSKQSERDKDQQFALKLIVFELLKLFEKVELYPKKLKCDEFDFLMKSNRTTF